MEIDLVPHEDCRIYCDWREYFTVEKESAVLELGRFASVEDYVAKGMNATARNRYRFSVKNGYYSHLRGLPERNMHVQQMHEINTSMEQRQGREMSESYKQMPAVFTTEETCAEHYSKWIFCYLYEVPVAYITVNFCGRMAAASQIMCHAAHLKNGAMLNAWVCLVSECMQRGITHIIYSRWSDGLDGLRYWKHSVGMCPAVVQEFKGSEI